MAESTQRLEIVTPEKKVFTGDVNFVVVPGELGELGFLPNHAPLMSALKIGIVRVQQEGKSFKVAVSGGFVEVRGNRVTILADTAERDDEIDRERAERARERAEKRLAEKSPDLDLVRAELALKRALNRLKALQ
ncbi:MAG: F0F1 ATP synthase subunit epsilon [Peptococcaceae bacterium]|nr:F0F1 ATP synthase subunit epsilon [Peptococcaceae bacterium]